MYCGYGCVRLYVYFLGDRDNEHFSLGCVGYKFVSVY